MTHAVVIPEFFAVIGGDDDQRRVVEIQLFQLGDDSADTVVGEGDLAAVQVLVAVAALLAALLSLESLFRSDYEDGSLEQMLLTPQPLSLLVLGKVLAHWLRTGLPLVLLAPLVGFQYYLAGDTLMTMMLALLLGTPVLSLLGAIGAALTLGVRGGGMLLSLLILPLYIPILVYGAGAVAASATQSLPAQPFLLLLGAFLILAMVLTPVATAAALRISLG